MTKSHKLFLEKVSIENQKFQMVTSDGLKWFVNPGDLPTIATWTPTAELRLAKNKNSVFNFNITNMDNNITITAMCI